MAIHGSNPRHTSVVSAGQATNLLATGLFVMAVENDTAHMRSSGRAAFVVIPSLLLKSAVIVLTRAITMLSRQTGGSVDERFTLRQRSAVRSHWYEPSFGFSTRWVVVHGLQYWQYPIYVVGRFSGNIV